MIKKIFFLILLISTANHVYGQFQVSGIVIETDESLPLPGVTITEKGTNNFTSTDEEGKFKIIVGDSQSILVFRFVGFVTREISIEGNHEINTFLKPYALMHFWVRQKIKLQLRSGVLETPIGGKLSISSPHLFNNVILEGSFRYQSNFKQNTFSKARISFLQIINSGRFNLDINFNRHSLAFQNDFNYLIKSFEFDLYIGLDSRLFWNFRPTIGFDEITYSQVGDNIEDRVSRGMTIGYRKVIGFLDLGLYPKVTFFKDLTSYSLKVNRYFRQAEFSIQFEKIGVFTELSLGIGMELTYLTKRQKHANTYRFD